MRFFIRRTLLVAATLVPTTVPVAAQHWLGLTPSNYAGLHAVFQQPAQVADSRYRLYINLAGVDGYAYTNAVRWAAPYAMWRFALGQVPSRFHNAQGELRFSPDDLIRQSGVAAKKGFGGGEIRGPGIMVSSRNSRWGAGFTTRIRVGGAVVNTTPTLAELIRTGVPGSQVLPQPAVSGQRGTTNFGSYAELGLTLGYVIRQDNEHLIKVGGSLKRLIGMYNVHLSVQDASYQLQLDPNFPGLSALNIQQYQGSYGYTTQAAYNSPSAGWLFGKSAPGSGWGLDLGVVYEYQPDAHQYRYTENGEKQLDRSRNKYQYRVSASLTDMGTIHYNNPNYVTQYDQLSGTNRPITHRSFIMVQNADAFFSRVSTILGADSSQRQTAFRSVLPTAINLSVDYKLDELLYINATWIQPLLSPTTVGLYRPAVLALIPRYELPHAELSLPISWQGNYANPTVGLAVRLGPVVLGSDHLPGLLNLGRPRGANAYASLSVPLSWPSPRDPLACYTPGQAPPGFWQRLFRR